MQPQYRSHRRRLATEGAHRRAARAVQGGHAGDGEDADQRAGGVSLSAGRRARIRRAAATAVWTAVSVYQVPR